MKNTIQPFLLLLALFCWLPSTLFAEVTYYHTDAMGTPMAMTDSTGKVVWQGDFYPFGEEYQIQAPPNQNKRRFIGKEKDEESGLHYFGARYMDEASGRFISPDPVTAVDAQTSKTNTALLANPLRLNRYVYGLNNPYKYIDSDGRTPLLLIPLAAAALIATNPDNANAPTSPSAKTYESHGTRNIIIEGAAGIALGSAGKLIPKKGLITPNKFFGNKTYKGAEKALTDKLHKDPSHRGGKGHIDIRKRDLPTNHYKDRPFNLKKDN